jgi:hypothetical protein
LYIYKFVLYIVGIQVFLNNGIETSPKGATSEDYDTSEFHLDEGEVITKIDVQSGWCVDRLTFHTSKARTMGPYGGTGGGLRTVTPPDSLPYLAWISFTVVQSQDAPVITALKFGYRYYSTDATDEDEDNDEDYPYGLSDSFDEYSSGASYLYSD